jgi:hypothetical protein
MFGRGIAVADVSRVVAHGEIIAEYPEDTPYPSVLLLGFVERRPIHVVIARDAKTGQCIVVTAYEPKSDQWEPGFKVRRTK